jgi:hypothetical protein
MSLCTESNDGLLSFMKPQIILFSANSTCCGSAAACKPGSDLGFLFFSIGDRVEDRQVGCILPLSFLALSTLVASTESAFCQTGWIADNGLNGLSLMILRYD